MELSKRLTAVAMLVEECESLADIGTDHGYIPIYLLEKKKIHPLYMKHWMVLLQKLQVFCNMRKMKMEECNVQESDPAFSFAVSYDKIASG